MVHAVVQPGYFVFYHAPFLSQCIDLFAEDFIIGLKPAGAVVDLTIKGAGGDIEHLKQLNESFLVDGLSMLTTGESAAIRIEVPEMNRFGEFAPQIDKAQDGLLAVSRLIELSHKIQV